MVEIGKLGIIKGGVCEGIFRNRKQREIGTISAVNWLLDNKCISIHKGWCQVVKFPQCLQNTNWVIKQCSGRGANYELGWRRFVGDIALPLYKSGKKFRLSTLKGWGANLAAFEFGIGTTDGSMPNPHDLEIIEQLQGKSKHIFGYAPPHQGHLFEEWKKSGN